MTTAELMFKNLGYKKIVVKEGVFFSYERPSDIDGYVERIHFDCVLKQFMASEVSEDDDESYPKYISAEEFVAINVQMTELGWCRTEVNEKSR